LCVLRVKLAQFPLNSTLLVPSDLIVVEHLLIAKDIKNELEELAAAVLTEFVCLTLVEREHAFNGPRETRAFELALVLPHALPDYVIGLFRIFDGQGPSRDAVGSHPFATLLLDSTQQGDSFRRDREEGRRPAPSPFVTDDAPQPSVRLVGVPNISAEVAT